MNPELETSALSRSSHQLTHVPAEYTEDNAGPECGSAMFKKFAGHFAKLF